MYRTARACRRGKDDVIRGDALLKRQHSSNGTCGQAEHVSGYVCHGACQRDYDFLQTGRFLLERYAADAAGHTGAYRFFGGDGTYAAGAGLCRADDQYGGRRTGTYADALEIVKTI